MNNIESSPELSKGQFLMSITMLMLMLSVVATASVKMLLIFVSQVRGGVWWYGVSRFRPVDMITKNCSLLSWAIVSVTNAIVSSTKWSRSACSRLHTELLTTECPGFKSCIWLLTKSVLSTVLPWNCTIHYNPSLYNLWRVWPKYIQYPHRGQDDQQSRLYSRSPLRLTVP